MHPGNFALSFHRTRSQPAHEVALQCEEDDQRDDHGDERAGSEHMPILATLANQCRQASSQYSFLRVGTQEYERNQQIVPNPQELEDGE